MIRVMIADDHHLIREGLKRILSDEEDVEIVGEAVNAQGLMKALGERDVDVLVLDINLPDASGFDLMPKVFAVQPRISIVVLSMLPEIPYARKALDAGATAFLTKGNDSNLVIEAIRNATTKMAHERQDRGIAVERCQSSRSSSRN